eukprot:TRINITY_DN2283_c0_g1_i2.p3 TRINITY_DN2283_c0_g1~~TRINITY_DN2283_c0_g1_i2.p3  ORF type:complete len:114 (-),score=7.71 TRINITY_DN2283_c0_g1_i2:109-450(-)
MVQRITYRRRHSYNSRGNKIKQVKTPGGRLIAQYRTKKATTPRCGVSGKPLRGIPALRPVKYSRLSKNKKTINRIYGGCLTHTVVRDRIIRAFLIEEQKIVKKVMKLQKQKEK